MGWNYEAKVLAVDAKSNVKADGEERLGNL